MLSDAVMLAIAGGVFSLLTAALAAWGVHKKAEWDHDAKIAELEAQFKIKEGEFSHQIKIAEAQAEATVPAFVQKMLESAQGLINMHQRVAENTEKELVGMRTAQKLLHDQVAHLTVENARLISQAGQILDKLALVQNELQETKGELRASRETMEEMEELIAKHGIQIPFRSAAGGLPEFGPGLPPDEP